MNISSDGNKEVNEEKTKQALTEEEINFLLKQVEQTKEDLEDLQRYVEEFARFLPLPVCMANPINVIVGINHAFQDMTGYTEMEVVGKRVDMLFQDEKKTKIFVRRVVKTKKRISAEMVLLTKKKAKIPVTVAGGVRRDDEGRTIGYFLGLSDISALKNFQGKLEEKVRAKTKDLAVALSRVEEERSHAELERNKTLAIVTHFADGILVFDNRSRLVMMNPQAEQFLGVNKKDFLQKSFDELKKNDTLQAILTLCEEKKERLMREEVPLKENVVIQVSTIPIIERTKQSGLLIILHDVTREKLLDQMKREFVAIAAHQLRTPLSAMKWTLRLLVLGDVGEVSPEAKEFLQKCYQENEQIINLVNDLLDVSRIDEGRYVYKRVRFALDKEIKELIAMYKKRFEETGLKVTLRMPRRAVPEIEVDKEKIRIALQNLIQNAMQYNVPQGKIVIRLKVHKEEKMLVLSIRDTGIGIPYDQADKVFTKFFRAHNALLHHTEGTGLGLYIVKNIIEAHGGTVRFTSKEGKGTIFYIRLPLLYPGQKTRKIKKVTLFKKRRKRV